MLAPWRARAGWGFIKASATNPRSPCGDVANRQPACVHTDTHMCTQVRQLCLDRAPLSVTFAELIPSPFAFSLPLSVGSIYDILLPISRRFRFHQVSDGVRLGFLEEFGHSLTPSSYRHNTNHVSDSAHGKVSRVSRSFSFVQSLKTMSQAFILGMFDWFGRKHQETLWTLIQRALWEVMNHHEMKVFSTKELCVVLVLFPSLTASWQEK